MWWSIAGPSIADSEPFDLDLVWPRPPTAQPYTDRRKPRTLALKRAAAPTLFACPTPDMTSSFELGILALISAATFKGKRTSLFAIQQEGRHVDPRQHVAQVLISARARHSS